MDPLYREDLGTSVRGSTRHGFLFPLIVVLVNVIVVVVILLLLLL